MSSKISIFEIVKKHFTTYKNENGKNSISDWGVMLLLPITIGAALCAYGITLNGTAYTNIVTAGAIFTGLLLNLLILVYDQKTKLLSQNIKGDEPGYENFAIRKRVIDEVHYNISYCIIICLIAVVLAVIASSGFSYSFVVPKINITISTIDWFVNFPLIFLCVHLVLTILMILKRVYKLISSH